MTSFAELLLPVVLGTGVAAAPDSGAGAPEPARMAVAERIAESWRVSPADLRLEWGRVEGAIPIGDSVQVRVSGRGTGGWFVAVFTPPSGDPVAVRVRAGVWDTVAVAARPLASGACLSPGDVRYEPRVRWAPPTTDTIERAGPGWEVRRALATGDEATWPAVVQAPLVKLGDPVRLLWQRGPVSLEIAATALHAARRGERLYARADGSTQRLSGTVIGPGTARLAPGDQR